MLDFITATDFYKVGHRRMLLPGTTHVLENWTGRAGRQKGVDAAVFLGLRAMLKYDLTDLAQRTFFSRPKSDVCYDYQLMLDNCLGPTEIGTEHIAALHDMQYLPLEYRALPEGTLVPYRVPSFTVENTHPDFPWLGAYLETLTSSRIWLPSQSATTARGFRKLMEHYCTLTGGNSDFIDWQGHDFSFRGMGSPEAAMMSGGGHLLYFKGTDTIPAIKMLHDVYEGEGQIGGSVAATEHMVMCLDGKENEKKTYERIMTVAFPEGVLSQVSDTWSLWNVLTNILPSLKSIIMERKGKLVVRPDSGDPVLILTGDASSDNPVIRKGVIELLWDEFGGTVNAKGFKELDSHIGAIYGDSITKDRAQQIFERLMAKGFASTNVVLGIGSYTYQYTTRDESGFAMKATWARVNGKEHFLSKDPITDSGLKKSARGRLAVFESLDDGKLMLCDGLTYDAWLDFDNNTYGHKDLLTPVWRDGRFLRRDKLVDIRARARA